MYSYGIGYITGGLLGAGLVALLNRSFAEAGFAVLAGGLLILILARGKQ